MGLYVLNFGVCVLYCTATRVYGESRVCDGRGRKLRCCGSFFAEVSPPDEEVLGFLVEAVLVRDGGGAASAVRL